MKGYDIFNDPQVPVFFNIKSGISSATKEKMNLGWGYRLIFFTVASKMGGIIDTGLDCQPANINPFRCKLSFSCRQGA